MMRYIAIPQIFTDSTFGFFMVSWLVTRHILFVLIMYSVLFHLPRAVVYVYDPSRGLFLTEAAWWGFCVMLSALEVRKF
jgi:acyl-CoA-dependent ceramide synthase